MTADFNALEVLKMAINVEENGERFYETCAEINTEKEVEKIFTTLAAEERKHLDYFQDLLDAFDESNEGISKNYLYEDLTSDYLKSIVDEQVFPNKGQATEDIAANLDDALDVGIKSEKNSILLYEELMKSEEDDETVTALKELISEEKTHLVKLQKLRSYA